MKKVIGSLIIVATATVLLSCSKPVSNGTSAIRGKESDGFAGVYSGGLFGFLTPDKKSNESVGINTK